MLALALFATSALQAAEPQKRSQNIVYIDGVKYYIHTAQAGETLASIARIYSTSEAELLKLNPTAADGLRIDQSLKIPFRGGEAASEGHSLSKKEQKEFKKSFTLHTIEQGETLYAISRRYEISVATILEDNPEADPQHLSIGSELRIRKKAIGRTNASEALAEMEQYEEQLNRVSVGEPYRYHVVEPKETIYSLSRQNGLSEEEFRALNREVLTEGLKAGSIVRLPNPDYQTTGEAVEEPEEPTFTTDSTELQSVAHQPHEVQFSALGATERLKVALLLPLTIDQKPNRNMAAFYQGFLLGLEQVKGRGRSVDATLYDTKRSLAEVERITQEPSFREADLIIGPIYADAIEPVLRHAEEASTPVVSPLGDLSTYSSDVLFQMAPTNENKYEKLLPLLDEEGVAITLIRTQQNDAEFEAEILKELGNRPYQYYDYESVQGVENAERSDLTPLLNSHDKHLFIVLSSGEVDVDRILASLASAQTNMVARSQRVPEFRVVGSSRWNRYTNIDRTTFFKDRVVLFSIFHAKRDNEQVRQFDARYIRIFGSLPTLYSYRGYETALIFCPGMFSDIEYDMEGRRYRPLQSPYTFEQSEGSLTHINREWVRVDYNPDFSITIE